MSLDQTFFNDTYEPERNADRYGMEVNPKTYHVASTLEKLGANQTQYGAPYCPCLPTHTEDTICPCRYMREMKACRCGLYVRPKGELEGQQLGTHVDIDGIDGCVADILDDMEDEDD